MASDKWSHPALGAILDTGKYSDLKIDCKGHISNAHKATVCAQSKPFAAMVDGGFKVRQMSTKLQDINVAI
jgi:hypothetical protein